MSDTHNPSPGTQPTTATASATATGAEALLQLRQIVKQYPGCLANDCIDLSLQAGEIHALLGENGAGKSTLVKIIYGVLQADSGQMLWQGNPIGIASPAQARALGIAMVFQHFSLFDSLSVQDNIALGLGTGSNDALGTRISEVSQRYGLALDPARYVYTLSVGERQRIEIVRCLLQEPRLLIMDEPTSVLTPQEAQSLFVTLRRLADEGVAILYISHKLDEIRALCSHATILRAGRKVAEADPASESSHSLAAMMIGSDIETAHRSPRQQSGETVFCLDNVNLPAADQFSVALQSVSLALRRGEILGMAGVAGNGQDELLQAIIGEVRLPHPGMLQMHGEPIGQLSAGARRTAGLCCLPEERLGHAAVPEMSLSDNAFLTAHHRLGLSAAGLLRQGATQQFAESVIRDYKVQCRNRYSVAGSLSGGNLQKFIVGREIAQQPDVLVIAQPTWGVDAGAAVAIHAAITQLAEQGSAILLISQDLDELMSLSDNLCAICAGRVSAAHPAGSVSVQQMGLLMGGGKLDKDSVVGGSAHV